MESRHEVRHTRFAQDFNRHKDEIGQNIAESSFLVIGGAGSIGREFVRQLWHYRAREIIVVDQNENALVELVRDLRSRSADSSHKSSRCPEPKLSCLVLDWQTKEFEAYTKTLVNVDYLLNFSALKHVRSEKDPFTLMRMVRVNSLNQFILLNCAQTLGVKKYFCVSTDKASNPSSLMGTTKRLMEYILFERSLIQPTSSARFANVEFSDGSLLHGLQQRMNHRQPIAAPSNIQRFFISGEEAAQLCMLSTFYASSGEILFPKPSRDLQPEFLVDKVEQFLATKGYKVRLCESSDEARALMETMPEEGYWPCLFTPSISSGEKVCEEFYSEEEHPDFQRYKTIGVIKEYPGFSASNLRYFEARIEEMLESGVWSKAELANELNKVVPSLSHLETGKSLDEVM